MSFVVGNSNGLMAPGDIFPSGPTRPAFYLTRKNEKGDVDISGNLLVGGNLDVLGDAGVDGDLDVLGGIYTNLIHEGTDISQNPIRIVVPKNLGGNTEINLSAVIIEGGEDRVDISQAQVGLAIYKPITRGIVDQSAGEQLVALAFWGKDLSDNTIRYADVRAVITNPTTGIPTGRINFVVANGDASPDTLLQIDGSRNDVATLSNATFTSAGRISALTDISAASTIRTAANIIAGTTILAGTDISCVGNLRVAGNSAVIGSSTVGANLTTVSATVAEVTANLGGIVFNVNTVAAGRVNSDATNMVVTGLTGTACGVQQLCGTRSATLATKDASDNITMAFGNSVSTRTALTVQDASGTTFVAHSYSEEVATGGGAAMPANASTSTFVPRYSGTYHFEMTYLFDTAGNGGVVNDDNVFGFTVSGAGNDYGAVLAGKAVTLPASGNALPYTISSLHQLAADTTYTITFIYLGTAGSKGGTAGGYLLEANLV